MSFVKTVAAALGAAALLATTATAATTNLRIQTHYAPETVSGKLAAQYITMFSACPVETLTSRCFIRHRL